MSGAFFGVFQADQSPVDASILNIMDKAMAYWGPDGGGLFCKGSLAFGARILKVTAEDGYERQPLIDGPHQLVARVRLDNRRDLCTKLGLVNSADLPDSRLILEAYRKYGHDCVQHLLGDWSFALWDEITQTLLIARDASGNTGVYYWWNGVRLVFSNGVKGILAHPDFEKNIDPLVLAGVLTVYVDPEVADCGIYKGIKKLLPGNLLVVRRGSLALSQWWQPDRLGLLNYKKIEDYYEEFVNLYDEVVGECLRVGVGRIAVTLSGGLDSGSVASLAAPRLGALGKTLSAFVHVPYYETAVTEMDRTGNELSLARATAKHVGKIEIIPIASEDKSILWGIQKELETHNRPGHTANHSFWMHDIHEQAKASGASVLLTGQMGNSTVSYTGHGSLCEPLFSGKWGSVVSALWQEEAGMWAGLRERILKPIIRPSLTRAKRWRLRSRQPWSEYSFIHPEFANGLNLLKRMENAAFDPTFATAGDPNGARMRDFRRLKLRGSIDTAYHWMESGAEYGVDVRDPTRDRRIVEFCLRVPDEAFWANGRRRGLIRKGMQSRLPRSVLECRAKGLQSADVLQRYQQEASSMLSVLEEAAQNPQVIVLDITRMKQTLNRLKRGDMVQLSSLHALGRSLEVALFLGL